MLVKHQMSEKAKQDPDEPLAGKSTLNRPG